jgi:hypothetical protein
VKARARAAAFTTAWDDTERATVLVVARSFSMAGEEARVDNDDDDDDDDDNGLVMTVKEAEAAAAAVEAGGVARTARDM